MADLLAQALAKRVQENRAANPFSQGAAAFGQAAPQIIRQSGAGWKDQLYATLAGGLAEGLMGYAGNRQNRADEQRLYGILSSEDPSASLANDRDFSDLAPYALADERSREQEQQAAQQKYLQDLAMKGMRVGSNGLPEIDPAYQQAELQKYGAEKAIDFGYERQMEGIKAANQRRQKLLEQQQGGGPIGKVMQEQTKKDLSAASDAAVMGQRLKALADRVRPAINQANTGPMSGVTALRDKAFAMFDDKEAQESLNARAVIESIQPDIIAAARPPGVGAMSDAEQKLYSASGPTLDRYPETNRLIVDTMAARGDRNIAYSDFLRAWAGAGGTTEGAAQAWQQYELQNPLVVETAEGIRPNTSIADWRTFFQNGGDSGQTQRSMGIEPNKQYEVNMPVQRPTSAPQYSEQQLRAANYSDADIQALRQQGLVK